MIKYSDNEIEQLINEVKILSNNWRNQIKFKEVRGSKQADFELIGKNTHKFKIVFRQSTFNNLDFSIILGIYPSNSTKLFHLKRYDGKTEHTNPIEKEKFYDFHIHIATERYQVYGKNEEDKYAQPTNKFTNLTEALQCMLEDCNFILPDESQLELNFFN